VTILSIFKNNDTRVTVLEERLQTFDEISRQMLSKLEQAVDKISESNQNISRILIRHEERIDRSAEANGSMLQLIEKTEKDLESRINNNDKEISDLKKTRWIWIGILSASTFFLTQFKIVDRLFPHTPTNSPAPYARTLDK
jgi:chromosome segregation ATPase